MARFVVNARPGDEALARGPVWLAMGFRPFFLGAAVFAAIVTPFWVHAVSSGASPGGGYLPPMLWHAHEMIFGYAMAVVAGFLLTAARNWTGQNTAHGLPLLGLFVLWLLGRAAMAGAFPPSPLLNGVLGVSFPVLLGVAVARPILRTRNYRNLLVVAVLGLIALAALGVHLGAGRDPGLQRASIYGALHLLIVLHVIIGGRIVPLFTRNRTGNPAVRNRPLLDRAAIVAALAVAILGAMAASRVGHPISPLLGLAALASGILQLVRMGTWGTGSALRIPLLAVLHLGYFWIGAGHLLFAASIFAPALPQSIALHALTIGVIGTMTVGMMTRVSLGHTGRPIRDSWVTVLAFASIALATPARLLGAVVPPERIPITWMVSGTLFALAVLVYFGMALVPLTTPRPDGRPG